MVMGVRLLDKTGFNHDAQESKPLRQDLLKTVTSSSNLNFWGPISTNAKFSVNPSPGTNPSNLYFPSMMANAFFPMHNEYGQYQSWCNLLKMLQPSTSSRMKNWF